jgi:predicted O-methyltransferase YrrM
MIVIRDSLGSHIRRITGQTIKYVADRIRQGIATEDDFNEVFKYGGNPYAADPAVLAMVTGIARGRKTVIETGSGLSSVLMGAVAGTVYSLEHIDHYAALTKAWCEEAGVSNVGICCAPFKDFWYDIDKFDLPERFDFGFCDGPPRFYGTRMKFFERIAPRCDSIMVDDVTADMNYARKVSEWAQQNGFVFTVLGRAAALSKPQLQKVA